MPCEKLRRSGTAFHSEQRGIWATIDQIERRQATSNKTPEKLKYPAKGQRGHFGAACTDCAKAQREAKDSKGNPNPVQNVTGTIADGGIMPRKRKL